MFSGALGAFTAGYRRHGEGLERVQQLLAEVQEMVRLVFEEAASIKTKIQAYVQNKRGIDILQFEEVETTLE